MRIAFDASGLLYRQMGIASYVRHLLAAFERVNEGNEFVLLLNDFRRNPDRVDHLPVSSLFHRRVSRLPSRLWRALFLDWRVPVDLISGTVDLLHVPDCVAPVLRRGKVIVTVHDMLDFVLPELFPHRLRDSSVAHYYRWRQRYVADALMRSDHVVAISENTRSDIGRIFGLADDRVSVIPYGLASHFQPIGEGAGRRAVLKRYGIEDDGFLLYVGRLEDRKNCGRLFQALRVLLDRGHVVPRLVVCGWQAHPVETGDALRTMADLRLDRSVQLVDYVPTEDLPCFYSAATALVYPSLYEGFGLPPLEAMACGTAVITSDTSSLPEVVGDAALCVDPYDVETLAQAIWRVVGDAELRRELQCRGLSRAGAFSWDWVAAATLELYESMV